VWRCCEAWQAAAPATVHGRAAAERGYISRAQWVPLQRTRPPTFARAVGTRQVSRRSPQRVEFRRDILCRYGAMFYHEGGTSYNGAFTRFYAICVTYAAVDKQPYSRGVSSGDDARYGQVRGGEE